MHLVKNSNKTFLEIYVYLFRYFKIFIFPTFNQYLLTLFRFYSVNTVHIQELYWRHS